MPCRKEHKYDLKKDLLFYPSTLFLAQEGQEKVNKKEKTITSGV